jgi:hypothetical protein
LLYAEISYYLDANFRFRFLPDTDFDAKLKINVDLTVAMPCQGKCELDIFKETCKPTNGWKRYLTKIILTVKGSALCRFVYFVTQSKLLIYSE